MFFLCKILYVWKSMSQKPCLEVFFSNYLSLFITYSFLFSPLYHSCVRKNKVPNIALKELIVHYWGEHRCSEPAAVTGRGMVLVSLGKYICHELPLWRLTEMFLSIVLGRNWMPLGLRIGEEEEYSSWTETQRSTHRPTKGNTKQGEGR